MILLQCLARDLGVDGYCVSVTDVELSYMSVSFATMNAWFVRVDTSGDAAVRVVETCGIPVCCA